ncbi:MAG: 3-methyl-2-oxobutanoate dehydrogenase subunit beta, partial [candidate division Zixibacteria bacterium]|nr:3-methyl-2-oxobutanoate dehydrogenase subunit beta [candidate division Zixibacteria bacterium]
VQEAVDLTMLAFYLADKYRNPVMLIGDGMIGQMMEAVEFPEDYKEPELPSSSEWAATGAEDRKARILKSLFLDPVGLENNALKLDVKYKQMIREEVRCESYKIDSANQILIIAYGTMARICQTAIDELEEEGISVGLFRPISLYPFPEQQILDAATRPNVKSVLTIEMSTGQMVEDVQKVVQGQKPVEFFGRTGGIVPTPEEVKEQVRRILSAKKSSGNKKA